MNTLHIPPTAFRLLYDDPNIGHEDRSLFVAVSYLRPSSIGDLARKVGFCREKVVASCKRLADAGWLRLESRGRQLKPVCWIPHEQQKALVDELKKDCDMAPLTGEFLTCRLTEFWVDHPRIIRNARPDFLENPQTRQRFELDIYVESILGVEFDGPQHYRETSKFSREQVDEIKAHDLMKEGMCKKAGIPLITLKAPDLSIEGMRKLLPPNIPLHSVDLEGPYAKGLDDLCADYRRKVARILAKEERR
ncbi:MAG TPA: hypothetical protein GXX23_01730 [Firmicutes bacterium]|nr:hypothetical protein [Candidatus Fermentithermobacillaceae bacterium]